jgi:hypothetical protein
MRHQFSALNNNLSCYYFDRRGWIFFHFLTPLINCRPVGGDGVVVLVPSVKTLG